MLVSSSVLRLSSSSSLLDIELLWPQSEGGEAMLSRNGGSSSRGSGTRFGAWRDSTRQGALSDAWLDNEWWESGAGEVDEVEVGVW